MRLILVGVLLCGSLLGDSRPARRMPLVCALPFIRIGTRISSAGSPHFDSEILLRKTKVDGKTWHETLRVEVTDFDENFKTVTMRRAVVSGQPEVVHPTKGTKDLRHLKEDPAAAYEHLGFVREIMAKNLGSYRRRRPHWTADFRKNLAKAAVDYLNDSVYTAVVDKRTNKVVGGVRFILAPYGVKDGKVVAEGRSVQEFYGPVSGFREEGEVLGPEQLPRPPRHLPEETELNIEVDHPSIESAAHQARDGLKMEMGALFVDETLSPEEHKKVWGELWLQTLKMSQSSHSAEINHYGTTIHAYADKFSLKLYLPLGFELNRSYYKDGKLFQYGPDEVVPPIKKADGSEWWPIVYHPEQINSFVKKWMEGKFKNRGGEDVKQRLGEIEELNSHRPVSMALQQVEALVHSFANDPGRAAVPASEVLMSLAHTQADHLRVQRAAEPNSDVNRRASIALQQLEPSFNELAEHLPKLVSAPEVWRRKQLAMVGRVFLETGEGRSVLSNAQVVEKILGPLLIDPDLGVRIEALNELQRAFPGRQNLLSLSNPSSPMSSTQAMADLKSLGLTEYQIEKFRDGLGYVLDSVLMRYTVLDNSYVAEEGKLRNVAQSLGELVGKDPSLVRSLLYLTHTR